MGHAGISRKAEHPLTIETMKKCCKHVDITNRNLIASAVRECLNGKMGRRDTLQMFRDYSGLTYSFLKDIAKSHQYWMFDGIIQTIIDGMQAEIRGEHFVWRPIWYTWRRENDKLRHIGIQNIKQQLYDYVAVMGLEEVLSKKNRLLPMRCLGRQRTTGRR